MNLHRRKYLYAICCASVAALAGCTDSAERQRPASYAPPEGSWPRLNYDYQNNRYNPHATPPREDPDEAWMSDVTGDVFRIVVADASVFVSTTGSDQSSRRIYALDPSDGTKRWIVDDVRTTGALHYADDRLYVGGRAVRAINAETGEALFETTLPTGNCYSTLECRGTIYVPTDSGVLYGLHADTGEILWQASATRDLECVIYDEGLLASTYSSVERYAMDRSRRASLRDQPPDVVDSWPLSYGGYVLQPVVVGNLLYRGSIVRMDQPTAPLVAYDLETREQVWERTLDTYVHSPVVDAESDRAYTLARAAGASASSGTVYMLRPTTGETGWKRDLDYRAGAPVVADGTVYVAGANVGSNRGAVTALDGLNGDILWERELAGGTFSHPLVSVGDRLYTGDSERVIALE